MQSLYRLIASIGLVVLMPGCLLHPDPQEIPGTYVAEYEFGTDTLILKSDGTYTQEIKVKRRSEPLRVTGIWKYDQSTNRVNLSDVYLMPNPYSDNWDEATATNRGAANLPVERYFFSRKLRFGPDEGHPFNKV
ncbi:MAG TPA: hypothetical protein VLA99_07525 [Nitrospiraceae bacterium]|nr:hypothetical protein [Nitrospiraceae bacterium]